MTARKRCRRPLLFAFLVACAAFVLLAAGCGGGTSPGVANVTTGATATTTQNAQSGLVAFSGCMRSRGFPNFPVHQYFAEVNPQQAIRNLGLSGPRFQAAMTACSYYLPCAVTATCAPKGTTTSETPQQHQTQLADALSFARCMRGHGLHRFPDPNAQGELSVEMLQAQGIDVHSPAVLRIVQACLPASHGALTPAKVREAISRAGG